MTPKTSNKLSGVENTATDSAVESTTFTQYASENMGLFVGIVTRVTTGLLVARKAIVQAAKWTYASVTPIGWLCVALVIAAIPLGLMLHWIEFTVAGGVALLLLVIAVPFLLGGKSYSVDFSLPEDRVVAGSDVHAKIVVKNVSARIELPGQIDVPIGKSIKDISVPLMLPGQVFTEDVQFPALRRGVIEVGPVMTIRTDPIGALRHEREWADVKELYIHPLTVSVPSTSAGFIRDLEGNPTANLVDSDISFHAIRHYAPGDGQRHIHWKSTAKTGELMVRQFEESRRSRMALILALNSSEFATEEEFETSVSAVGSLGVRAIRDGRDLSVITSAEIAPGTKKVVRSIRSLSVLSSRSLLDELCRVEASDSAMDLNQVCALTAQALSDISIVFIACGSSMTPKQLQHIRLRLPQDVAVVALLCDPGDEPRYRIFSGVSVLNIGILDDLRALLSRYNG